MYDNNILGSDTTLVSYRHKLSVFIEQRVKGFITLTLKSPNKYEVVIIIIIIMYQNTDRGARTIEKSKSSPRRMNIHNTGVL